MKIQITGASNFVSRMFEACGSYQWARELLKNSLEASAKRVLFGIEWQAVEKLGAYRRTVSDDGAGMDREELRSFFSTLGLGGKKIGGIHDNFGVGAKIAALPWNPEGLVVISYKNGIGSMIWIVFDPDTSDYELMEFHIGEQANCVITPREIDGVDWAAVAPDWAREHGTTVVMLGSTEYPDTVLGNPAAGEGDTKGLSVYLNSRFWDLSDVEVTVAELRSPKKHQWPSGPKDRDDSKRPNNRAIHGAKHWIHKAGSAGKLAASNVEKIEEDRVAVEWYLWEGTRPPIHSYAREGGYIAVRYNGELFQLTNHKAHFRWFGVIEGKVQQNLTLILEPQHYIPSNGRWGVHADQSRNRLIFSGGGEKGIEIPLADWGMEFAEDLPAAVLEAIRNARGSQEGAIDDEEYRKRLQDRFGSRWKTKVLIAARSTDKDESIVGGTPTSEDTEIIGIPDGVPNGDGSIGKRRPRRKRTVKVLAPLAEAGGDGRAVLVDAPVDVPRYRLTSKDNFERAWHLALWAPNDLDGPTVLINTDSPLLEEVVHHHQEQYPDIYADEVARIVRAVFGEVAACKVAHAQKLTRDIPVELIDQEYRTEQALTISLMGLLAEESLIAQRLGKLGRKKSPSQGATPGENPPAPTG